MTSPSDVAASDVRVCFGDQMAIDRVHLRITAGERVALVGPSGAGKSTLLSLFNRLVSPTEGTVSVSGRDLAELSPRALRRARSDIGMVHQHLDLTGPLRVLHNVDAGRLGTRSTFRTIAGLVWPTDDGAVHDALEAVGLAERAWDRTDSLSGGERQRVAIARVLLQRPTLLLADEPVASLDPELSRRMLELLCGDPTMASPWTTIVSLHEPDLALRHADRIIGMARGTIAFDLASHEVTSAELDQLYRSEPTR